MAFKYKNPSAVKLGGQAISRRSFNKMFGNKKSAKSNSNSKQNASDSKNVYSKRVKSKSGRTVKTKQDVSRRQYKLDKMKLKNDKTNSQLELEKVKSNNATKVALGGEAAAGISGTVTGSVGVSQQQARVDGGLANKGGLGRDDANSKNDPDKNANDWESIIGGLGY